jgi:hypothetical protein
VSPETKSKAKYEAEMIREFYEPTLGLTVREHKTTRWPFMRFQIGIMRSENRTVTADDPLTTVGGRVHHLTGVQFFHLLAWGATLEEATAKIRERFNNQPLKKL